MTESDFRAAATFGDSMVALMDDGAVSRAAALYDDITAALAAAGVVDGDVAEVFGTLLPAHVGHLARVGDE